MRNKAVFVSILLLGLAPGISTAAPDDAPRVRLKARAELTMEGTTRELDSSRWFEGRLVASDADSVTLAMNSAGDPARLRVPRWGIVAFEVYRGRERGIPILIGLGVGLGAGLIGASAARAGCTGLSCVGAGVIPLMILPPVGAVIGGAVGRSRWEPMPVDGVAGRP